MARTKTAPSRNSVGLRIENGALRVGGDTIFDGIDGRFEVHSVPDTRVNSECFGRPISECDPVRIGVLSFREMRGTSSSSPNSNSSSKGKEPLLPVTNNTGKLESRHVLRIARSLPGTSRFLANARCKLWWMTPTWGGGDSVNGIPPETQFLLLQQTNGTYVAALPLISHDGFRSTLSGHALDAATARTNNSASTQRTNNSASTQGTHNSGATFGTKTSSLCLVTESGCAEVRTGAVQRVLCVAHASSPFEACEAVVRAASRAMSESFKLRVDKTIPPTTEVFGWCTWDAFYHSVTPGGIERGIHSLAAGGVPAKFVIIDDGWQSVSPDAAYKKKVDHITDHPPRSSPGVLHGETNVAPATPVKDSNVGESAVKGGSGTPQNASPSPSGSPPFADDGGKYAGPNRNDAESGAPRAGGRRQVVKRTASRLKNSVTSLATTEVHRGNDRIENAMATLLVDTRWWPTRAAVFVATAMGSGLETWYWHGIHASPYLGVSWRWFKFLGQGLFGPVIRYAVSTLSCFNHRVHLIEANVKFRRPEGFSVTNDALNDDRELVGSRGKRGGGSTPTQNAGGKKPRTDADGFKDVIGRIKGLGVSHVYCWHAFFGYWGGLHPDSSEMRQKFSQITIVAPEHTPGLLAVEPSQAWDPITVGGVGVVANTDDYSKFFDELHMYLAASGVDGVKVDGQAVVGGLGRGRGGGPAMAKNMHLSLERSVKKHFPTNGLINCMCHSSENILNFKDSALARVSDDFYPTNKASHTVHVANVAYNSIFMGEIVVPDWDMFQSHCGQAGALHAAARAVGGCPVYVSDAPGQHDFALLRKLVFPSGKVLRARLPGRPTRDCVFTDPCTDGSTALKIWNKNHVHDSGVVGCFNVQGASWSRKKGIFVEEKNCEFVIASVAPKDVETLRRNSDFAKKFVTMAHRSGEVRVLSMDDHWRIKLPSKQWEIFTIAAKRGVSGAGFEGGKPCFKPEWAFVGLTGMLNGGGAVLADTFTENEETYAQTVTATAEVYGCGSLSAWAKTQPLSVAVNGEKVTYAWTPLANENGGGAVVTIPLGVREGTHAVDLLFVRN